MSFRNNHRHEHEPPAATGPEGTKALASATPEPTTRLERRTLELLEETHGDAFRAYLAHVWDATPVKEIENEFTNLYWASYPDRKTFIDSVINGLGWKEGYIHLVERSGIPPEFLNWNYPLLLARVQEDYELLDQGGNVHVFFR